MMNIFGRGDAAPAEPSSDASSSLLSSVKKSLSDLNPMRQEPEPEGLLSEFTSALSTDWGLTWTQRLTGFAACFSLGLLCSILSTFFMLQPTKFGITYRCVRRRATGHRHLSLWLALGVCACLTQSLAHFLAHLLARSRFASIVTIVSFGNLLSLGSTGFLVGPGRQMRNMFQSHRAIATLIFFAMLGMTLYAALKVRSPRRGRVLRSAHAHAHCKWWRPLLYSDDGGAIADSALRPRGPPAPVCSRNSCTTRCSP